MSVAEKQEPVAWMNVKEDMTYLNRYNQDDIPLYMQSVPPKPEWVGLTDDEIMQMYCEPRSDREMLEFAREFETKLKDKNHG